MKNFKILIIGIFLLSATQIFGQNVTVRGTFKEHPDGQFQINYSRDNKQVVDTVEIKDEKFLWAATINGPEKTYLMFPTRYLELYIEPGNIHVVGHADSLHKMKVTGSSIQDEVTAFQETLIDLEKRQSPLYQKYGKVGKEEQLEIERELSEIGQIRLKRTKEYIRTHPKNIYSLMMVEDRAAMGSYEEVQPLFNLIDPSIKETSLGNKVSERLKVLKRSVIGEKMYSFSMNNQNGENVNFDDFLGKYILVEFWASWCGPCRAENPNVLKAYNTFKDKGFTVIGISLDDNEQKWKQAIEEDSMPWTQVSTLDGFENEVSSYYGIRGIPSSFLVDPQGKIVARNLRGERLHETLNDLLNSKD
ncbi:MAG TPA: AhpC/TSA family protein [Candidatus Sphingobacterium stercoripullorum]|uniref:AhpC/TSA family protein n=1 Tax=Candidatus Sphingobacterium stercoripullorum TaxID=2838759 RepID=A0A9D1W6I4_9SPHI|nr:AhpC/TSA family protein [Candidatus Sphingobacterium stercoripullorum]